MARRTYNYIDYSPTAITLAIEENWLKLAVVISSTSPSPHKVLILTPRLQKDQEEIKEGWLGLPENKAPQPSRRSASAARSSLRRLSLWKLMQ
ncbi:hypothetical protein ACLOJK_029224 [Asimina triloba]